MKMRYKYGIDFGTTNSSIAIRFIGDDKQEHTMVADVRAKAPREVIPSVVLIDRNGKIYAGEEAADRYIQSGTDYLKKRFIKKIKLDLENMSDNFVYEVDRKKYQGCDLIASILKVLRSKAENLADELGIDMSGVVMGVPVEYGDIQKGILKQALVKAGYYKDIKEADAKTEFVSEPIAVAVHYGLDNLKNRNILVFDFGGGTLDVAVVKLKKQQNDGDIRPHETIAKERITLGGEELTRLFFINSFCATQKYGTKKLARAFSCKDNLKPEVLWQKLLNRDEGIRFINAIEQCKCELSMTPKYKFTFMGRGILLDEVTFYRDDFDKAISIELNRINDLVEKCLESAKIEDPFEIDNVILAGGSSLIPSVQKVLTDIFGNTRVSSKLSNEDKIVRKFKRNSASESEVLTSIVRGLAAIGCQEEPLIEDVVDNDYGVWDMEENKFIPIITKGMPVKKTAFDRLSRQGISQLVECRDAGVTSVEFKVFQKNLNGEQQLGTISIPNPGGKEYEIFMNIDAKTGMLVVTLYDVKHRRWIDEIPLSQRQYIVK